MVSVLGSTETELQEICKKTGAEMSNINSIGQIVLSGTIESIDRAIYVISQETAAKTIKLTVAGAFHSSLMNSAKDEFVNFLQDIKFGDLKYPVVSNVTGDFYKNSNEVKELLPIQIVSAVRWVDCMMTAKNAGVVNLYQCGNGKVLVNLARSKVATPLITATT
jgi:[acyl-carrier-protein] S-malonyltransferase